MFPVCNNNPIKRPVRTARAVV